MLQGMPFGGPGSLGAPFLGAPCQLDARVSVLALPRPRVACPRVAKLGNAPRGATWRPWGDHLTPKGAHLAPKGDHLESSWGQLPQVAENIRNRMSFCMLTQPTVKTSPSPWPPLGAQGGHPAPMGGSPDAKGGSPGAQGGPPGIQLGGVAAGG